MPTQNQTPIAYTTLVRPILEYASIIWDPHTASNIHKLETVRTPLSQTHHAQLQYTCQRHNHAPAPTPTYTTTTPPALQNYHAIQNHTPTSQHSNCHLLHHTIHSEYSTRILPCPFFPSTIKIWNNLQPVITNTTTIYTTI